MTFSQKPKRKKRVITVKNNHSRITNPQMVPVANYYIALIQVAGVLALLTGKNPHLTAAWLLDFIAEIENVKNIKSSNTIRKQNKDLTAGVKTVSKDCVELGLTLTQFLNITFVNQPGLIESFGVMATNNFMRNVNIQSTMNGVNTIIQQINENLTALEAGGYPAANLAAYIGLYKKLEILRTAQQVALKSVPENTDEAMIIRNRCFDYIKQTLVCKDIVYYGDKVTTKKWALATILKQVKHDLAPVPPVL